VHLLDQRIDAGGLGDIAGDRQNVGSNLGQRLARPLERACIATANGDVTALRRYLTGKRQAEAAGAAGDDHGLVDQAIGAQPKPPDRPHRAEPRGKDQAIAV
jgi:hypothetical protein